MPIRTREELGAYLAADLKMSDFNGWTWRNQVSATSRDRIMRWQRSLRRLEYLTAQPRRPWLRIALPILWRLHMRRSVLLGFTIPLNVFGPGLSIPHYGPITVNERARVGAECRIHTSTTIGVTHDGAPTIGDYAYIGAGARIAGPVELGDYVTVAPNAVITESFPDNSTIIGGVPARVLQRDVPYLRRH